MVDAQGLVPLEEAAMAVDGLSRDSVYRVAVKLGRIKAYRVISRINNRLRVRWMVSPDEVRHYFNQTTLIQEFKS